ncbi:MAG: serine/threonine protein kinase, partial [Deltaproteobacteria bacterium]|nr:serine/threonine protein kinase [Deltaproteobacteria bacterium]
MTDAHPTFTDLVERSNDPDVQDHVASCPKCRVELRLISEIFDSDPTSLPQIGEARERMGRARHEASLSMSSSVHVESGEEDDDLEPGRALERYTVQSLVGRGGMGTVYRVRHNQLGSIHALKVLHWASRTVRNRLMREGQAQSRLRHPNVVTVTDLVDVDGAPGLIMEHVDGPSLSELLRERKRLALPEVDRFAEGIIRGVDAAHRAGLVHRDLKPANVLLAPGDEGYVPKVADFGLARLAETGGSDPRLTRSDTPMGTPSYMAPEQIRDASSADVRSDIFSLGAVLYELVTGRRAFDGLDVVDIYDRIRTGEFTPPERVVDDLPERMRQTIERALEVDPERR